MTGKQWGAIVAEICIAVLGGIALAKGMNGAIFTSCIGALAGLGGYSVHEGKKLG